MPEMDTSETDISTYNCTLEKDYDLVYHKDGYASSRPLRLARILLLTFQYLAYLIGILQGIIRGCLVIHVQLLRIILGRFAVYSVKWPFSKGCGKR